MVRKKEEEIWSIYNLQISIVDYHIIDNINIAFIFRAQFDIDTPCILCPCCFCVVASVEHPLHGKVTVTLRQLAELLIYIKRDMKTNTVDMSYEL